MQEIFGENFNIWGHSFSLGKILNYISGANFFLVAMFSVGGNLKSSFFRKILFLGGIFSMGNFVYGKS